MKKTITEETEEDSFRKINLKEIFEGGVDGAETCIVKIVKHKRFTDEVCILEVQEKPIDINAELNIEKFAKTEKLTLKELERAKFIWRTKEERKIIKEL